MPYTRLLPSSGGTLLPPGVIETSAGWILNKNIIPIYGNSDYPSNYLLPFKKIQSSANLPDGMSNMFRGYSLLTRIIGCEPPNTITNMSNAYMSSNLQSAIVGNNVTDLSNAFSNCPSLDFIRPLRLLPANVNMYGTFQNSTLHFNYSSAASLSLITKQANSCIGTFRNTSFDSGFNSITLYFSHYLKNCQYMFANAKGTLPNIQISDANKGTGSDLNLTNMFQGRTRYNTNVYIEITASSRWHNAFNNAKLNGTTKTTWTPFNTNDALYALSGYYNDAISVYLVTNKTRL